jgi:hypothetical protein
VTGRDGDKVLSGIIDFHCVTGLFIFSV